MSLPAGTEHHEADPFSLEVVATTPAPLPTLHDEMLASIARTGFTSDAVRIPSIPAEVIHHGNARVTGFYGNHTRSLTIIGPDVVAIGDVDGYIRLQRARSAELLGHVIAVRAVVPAGVYKQSGFGIGLTTQGSIDQSVVAARNDLDDTLIDARGESIITHTGIRGGYKFGMEDVVVRDLRNSPAYQQARELRTAQLIETFIREGGPGGPMPSLVEPAMLRAAGKALARSVDEIVPTGNDKSPYKRIGLTSAQKARHTMISELRAAMLTSRSDAYNERFSFDESSRTERRFLRSAVADAFEPTWQSRGRCRGGQIASIFFPPPEFERKNERLEREAKAKAVCAKCPVQPECLELGVTTELKSDGIFGGMNREERHTLIGLSVKRRGKR